MILTDLKPFLCENFITIPLSEEGNYTPSLNIWHFLKEKVEVDEENKLVGFNSEELRNKGIIIFINQHKRTNGKWYVEFEITFLRNPAGEDKDFDIEILYKAAIELIAFVNQIESH